jgi:hypothetical protein
MGRVVLRTVWEENIEWNLFSVQFLFRPFLETYSYQPDKKNFQFGHFTIVCDLPLLAKPSCNPAAMSLVLTFSVRL